MQLYSTLLIPTTFIVLECDTDYNTTASMQAKITLYFIGKYKFRPFTSSSGLYWFRFSFGSYTEWMWYK